MSKTQIASLSLKLVGIYSIIQAIPILKSISEVFALKDSVIFSPNSELLYTNYLLIGTLTSFSLLLFIGIFLIVFSQNLAHKMIENKETHHSLTELSAKNIQAIAFSIIGVVMFVLPIPKLVQLGANFQALSQAGDETITKGISIGTWAYSIGLTVQGIIGLLLFFGAKGLSTVWYFFQKTRPMKNL